MVEHAEVEHRRGEYLVSTNTTQLNVPFVHRFLSQSTYWAQQRPLAVVEKSIDNSLCFGLYVDGAQRTQVGFARVVTDHATFAWLCDVFVVDAHRNRGLSKWLVECVMAHPDLQDIARFVLATRDAHELYRNYADFDALPNPEMWMARRRG
jgi:hypothetical protein